MFGFLLVQELCCCETLLNREKLSQAETWALEEVALSDWRSSLPALRQRNIACSLCGIAHKAVY
jgi:hypothetical protein